LLVGVQLPGLAKEHFSGFRVGRIRDAAVVHWTDRGALWLIKVADAFGAAIVSDDVDAVAYSLTITDVISFSLCIAPCLENGLVGTFRHAGSAGDTFISD
jgi:hypothetical protein